MRTPSDPNPIPEIDIRILEAALDLYKDTRETVLSSLDRLYQALHDRRRHSTPINMHPEIDSAEFDEMFDEEAEPHESGYGTLACRCQHPERHDLRE